MSGIVALSVADVRSFPVQVVEHTPIQRHRDPAIKHNRAHTDVFGPHDDLGITHRFSRVCRVVIRPRQQQNADED